MPDSSPFETSVIGGLHIASKTLELSPLDVTLMLVRDTELRHNHNAIKRAIEDAARASSACDRTLVTMALVHVEIERQRHIRTD
jgi:hypothetical protein